MKYIIIGGVAGGATTATRIRRNDEKAEIILLEKGEYISYANCGLPYYIGGVIAEREKLFVQTPDSFSQRFRVDVRVNNEAIRIDRATKEVTIRNEKGETYIEHYDKLLLSPGAKAIHPTLPGVDTEGIFTLRNVIDTDQIKSYTSTHAIKRAVVVGAGFIGLEMAENLHTLGAEISIVEMANQAMTPIDFSMAGLVHQHLLQKGVRLYLEESVVSFSKCAEGIEVMFKSGERVMTDIVILSIGVRPQTQLAEEAGLAIGEMGGIVVNEYLQTSDEYIYAVGDAIEFPHPLTGKPWLNYLAGPANRQGRIVADNLVYGNHTPYEGSIGTAIAKVFDLTVATTGIPAKRLQHAKIEYISSTTHSNSHAGYYPGSLPLTVKIMFDPKSGKLYGATVIGYDGVDKRIDQIALVIKNNGTIYDLTRVEQAYAPPYSSAKDPIAIAGYVAENIITGKMNPIHWREFRDADPAEVAIIDVRTPEEFALGAIPGAKNIPLDELRERLDGIPTNRPIYLYCAIGLRGYLASRILLGLGYTQVRNLVGGYKTYNAAVAPITNCSTSKKEKMEPVRQTIKTIRVDATGLQCPGPILKLKKSIDSIQEGEQMEIIATDPGFPRDAAAWCNSTGNNLIEQNFEEGTFHVIIQKGGKKECASEQSSQGKGKTFIVFSDDLDKALAAFVLANGAAATGEKVTIFFTFWGLNVIKKVKKPTVTKDIFGKMFSLMLPSSSKKLKLSKMSMGGIGGVMMRHIMKKRGIDSLESLRQAALDSGVEFIACQMSMDVMGVKREELLDEATIGGVATYMDRADQANVNLFI